MHLPIYLFLFITTASAFLTTDSSCDECFSITRDNDVVFEICDRDTINGCGRNLCEDIDIIKNVISLVGPCDRECVRSDFDFESIGTATLDELCHTNGSYVCGNGATCQDGLCSQATFCSLSGLKSWEILFGDGDFNINIPDAETVARAVDRASVALRSTAVPALAGGGVLIDNFFVGEVLPSLGDSGSPADIFDDFESYTIGSSMDTQGSPLWVRVGGSPAFDEEVVSDGAGGKSWRLSNAVTTTAFGNNYQLGPGISNQNDIGSVVAGEAGSMSSGTASPTTDSFAISFDFRTVDENPQVGLAIDIHSGDNAATRQSLARIIDDGIDLHLVYFSVVYGAEDCEDIPPPVDGNTRADCAFEFPTTGCNGNRTLLERGVTYHVRMQHLFVDGLYNDEVDLTVFRGSPYT